MELRHSKDTNNLSALWLVLGLFVVLAFVLSFPASNYYLSKDPIAVQPHDASLVTVYGRGFARPTCGAENEITVSFAQPGLLSCDSELQIYTKTNRSGAADFSRKWIDDKTMKVIFHLGEDGPFTLAVVWQGKHLPGSPYRLHARMSNQCLYADPYRLVPVCQERVFERLDDGRWSSEGTGWRPFDCDYRLFQAFFQGCDLLRWRMIANVILIGDETMLKTMQTLLPMFGVNDFTLDFAYQSMLNKSDDPQYRESCYGGESIIKNSSICYIQHRIPNFDYKVYCSGGQLNIRFLFAYQALPHLIPTALAGLKGNVLILQSFLPGIFYFGTRDHPPFEFTAASVSASETEQQLRQILSPLVARPDASHIMYVFRPGYVDRASSEYSCAMAAHLEAHSKAARNVINSMNNKRVKFYETKMIVESLFNTSREDREKNLQLFHWHTPLAHMQYQDVFDQHMPVFEFKFGSVHGHAQEMAPGAHVKMPPRMLTFDEIRAGVTLEPQEAGGGDSDEQMAHGEGQTKASSGHGDHMR